MRSSNIYTKFVFLLTVVLLSSCASRTSSTTYYKVIVVKQTSDQIVLRAQATKSLYCMGEDGELTGACRTKEYVLSVNRDSAFKYTLSTNSCNKAKQIGFEKVDLYKGSSSKCSASYYSSECESQAKYQSVIDYTFSCDAVDVSNISLPII